MRWDGWCDKLSSIQYVMMVMIYDDTMTMVIKDV